MAKTLGERRRERDEKTRHRLAGKCGAKNKRQGTICRLPAGWGTEHYGKGKCKWHGGAAPSGRKAAIKGEAIQFMGAPMDINPLEAIIWCIRITAGEVQWLSMKIAEADEVDWIENTVAGKQLNVFQRSRADAQDRLVRYSKDAIQLGLAERAIRLAENFGLALARLLEGIESELNLTPAQKTQWTKSVRKHLILLQGGRPVDDDDPDVIQGELVAAS